MTILEKVDSRNKEFKKLQCLLQQKCHIKIELCLRLSVLQLFYVGYVAQGRQSALLLASHKWFSYKGKECRLALSSEPI